MTRGMHPHLPQPVDIAMVNPKYRVERSACKVAHEASVLQRLSGNAVGKKIVPADGAVDAVMGRLFHHALPWSAAMVSGIRRRRRESAKTGTAARDTCKQGLAKTV